MQFIIFLAPPARIKLISIRIMNIMNRKLGPNPFPLSFLLGNRDRNKSNSIKKYSLKSYPYNSIYVNNIQFLKTSNIYIFQNNTIIF